MCLNVLEFIRGGYFFHIVPSPFIDIREEEIANIILTEVRGRPSVLPQLETIPQGRAPANIFLPGLSMSNFRIGDPGGQLLEHSTVPIAKLIDLGSVEQPRPPTNTRDNRLIVGIVSAVSSSPRPTLPVSIKTKREGWMLNENDIPRS